MTSVSSSKQTPSLPKNPIENLLELKIKAKIYSLLRNTEHLNEKERNSLLNVSGVFSAFGALLCRRKHFYQKTAIRKEKLQHDEFLDAYNYLKITSTALDYFLAKYSHNDSPIPFISLYENQNPLVPYPSFEEGWKMLIQNIAICNFHLEKLRNEKINNENTKKDITFKAEVEVQAFKKSAFSIRA